MQLRLERDSDRWRSVVGWSDGQEFHPLLKSIEGGGAELWPPSPPLQQALPGGTDGVLLATGMAGNSHWSVSVEVAEGGGGLTWDVACRVKQPAELLGSAYGWVGRPNACRVAPPAAGQAWALCFPAGCLVIRPLAATGQCAVAGLSAGAQAGVRIQPGVTPGPYPQTVRWAYQMEWVGEVPEPGGVP